MVMVSAAGSGVADTRPAAGFPRDGVLEVASPGAAAAGWPRAFPVADVNEVPEFLAGVVGGRFVPVVAVGDGHGLQVDGQVRPMVHRPEPPDSIPAVPAGWLVISATVPAVGSASAVPAGRTGSWRRWPSGLSPRPATGAGPVPRSRSYPAGGAGASVGGGVPVL